MQAVTLVPAALVAGLFTFAAAPPALRGQDRPQDADFVIAAGKHNIRELIDRAAVYLGRNYVYSETDLSQSPDQDVTIQNQLVLDAVGCKEVVSELAFTKGIVMLPIDERRGIFEWIHMNGPLRGKIASHSVEMTPEEVLRNRNLRIPVRTTYPLHQLDANMVVNQLRPFFVNNQGPTLTIGCAGNALLLQGFPHEVATAVETMEKLESPPAELEPGLSTWKARVDQRLDAIEKALRR